MVACAGGWRRGGGELTGDPTLGVPGSGRRGGGGVSGSVIDVLLLLEFAEGAAYAGQAGAHVPIGMARATAASAYENSSSTRAGRRPARSGAARPTGAAPARLVARPPAGRPPRRRRLTVDVGQAQPGQRLGTPALAALVVAANIRGHPVQPGQDRPAGLDRAAPASPDLEEHRRGQVLGRGPGPGPPEAVVVDHRPVPLEDLGHRRPAAGPQPLGQPVPPFGQVGFPTARALGHPDAARPVWFTPCLCPRSAKSSPSRRSRA